MSTAIMGNPALFADEIIHGPADGVNVITKGDWVQWSGGNLVGLGTQATPAYRLSGAGVALANNPVYDDLGRAMTNSALPVLTHGVLRVSGGSAASLTGAPGLGAAIRPATTASGIVGQTGATGVGGVWVTAARQSISANPTGALASGVGKLINIFKAGDITAAQWDILFDARSLAVDYY
jgi:hypothetical protein